MLFFFLSLLFLQVLPEAHHSHKTTLLQNDKRKSIALKRRIRKRAPVVKKSWGGIHILFSLATSPQRMTGNKLSHASGQRNEEKGLWESESTGETAEKRKMEEQTPNSAYEPGLTCKLCTCGTQLKYRRGFQTTTII